ncbi:Predicted arabinose efflux permease, MFS family [Pedococcus dokdonensis]|uniref:Predicted arabinose efflux permease, MFS family n=1 Tax=Pedococcus dokdonensis TaxID=443156 RepID=A0A1H0PTK1_9MICO|nr:MFS transporter [Pedococcus dokdonensis]SDP07838.1 Predicted arabinose efflux permease, MFS family [Pedococcus dokdonensis]
MQIANDRYRRVLAIAALRRALVLGFLVRVPIFAGGVVLTLHVVSHLGRAYAEAGLVSAAATIAIAISGPWRGRLLDRRGLRRVVVPSIVVAAVCWSIAPFVAYWWLLGLAALAGLFVIPSFSIIRQAVIAAVDEDDRRTAISLDSVAVEMSFMVGPAAGVWAATVWPTQWVLFVIEMLGVLAGVLLWFANPVLHDEAGPAVDDEGVPAQAVPVARSGWFRARFIVICLAAAATTLVLGGTDIAIVAALRDFDAQSSIGWVLAVWGFGSLLGGLVYGGMKRSVSAFWLLGGLALVTVPMALALGTASLAVLSFVAGLLCAPTITATVDQVSRVVPGAARGEAMGWHGSFMTGGMALGAPLAGFAIDRFDWQAGFVVVATTGLVVALLGAAATSGRATERRAAARTRAAAEV